MDGWTFCLEAEGHDPVFEQQHTKIEENASANCGLSFMHGGPPFLPHTL